MICGTCHGRETISYIVYIPHLLVGGMISLFSWRRVVKPLIVPPEYPGVAITLPSIFLKSLNPTSNQAIHLQRDQADALAKVSPASRRTRMVRRS
jgi:hypothetical protein